MKSLARLLSVLILSGAALAQPAKPTTLTADKVLAAYESAVRSKDAKPFTRVLLDYQLWSSYSHRLLASYDECLWTDGRFYRHTDDISNVTSQIAFNGHESWFSGMPMFLGGSMDIAGKVRDTFILDDSNRVAVPSKFFPGLPNWRNDYKSFDLLGASMVEGKKAIVIRGVLKSGDSVVFYFDAASMLLAKSELPIHVKRQSGEKVAMLLVRYYSNYGDFQGWKLPRHVIEEISGGRGEFSLGKVQFDAEFDEKKLEKPKL